MKAKSRSYTTLFINTAGQITSEVDETEANDCPPLDHIHDSEINHKSQVNTKCKMF